MENGTSYGFKNRTFEGSIPSESTIKKGYHMKKFDESELTILVIALSLILAVVFSWLFAFVSG